MDIN
jgi:hypothetical protein